MQIEWKIAIRPLQGSPRGGDMGVYVPLEDGALAALIDASGHGLAAYSVAQAARNTILESRSRAPDVLLQQLDEALRGTIGAAVSIARIYPDRIEFSGVGNVRASIGLKPLLLRAGVVGVRMRPPKNITASLPRDNWLFMHTDGVSRPTSIPHGSAETVANALLDSCGSDNDDAGILLVRWRDES
jgi:hypothetical protein